MAFGDRAPRESFDVVCAECGVQTTVPFKPTGDRPVKCRDCFQKGRPPRSDRPMGGARSFGGAGPGGDRPMFDATCTRCGVQTQVPFKPTAGRDVFCRDCFRGSSGGR
ncbi:MAG: CxxC-x17-CxxC domain-containing protein [Thermoplasmatota archaeon]